MCLCWTVRMFSVLQRLVPATGSEDRLVLVRHLNLTLSNLVLSVQEWQAVVGALVALAIL